MDKFIPNKNDIITPQENYKRISKYTCFTPSKDDIITPQENYRRLVACAGGGGGGGSVNGIPYINAIDRRKYGSGPRGKFILSGSGFVAGIKITLPIVTGDVGIDVTEDMIDTTYTMNEQTIEFILPNIYLFINQRIYIDYKDIDGYDTCTRQSVPLWCDRVYLTQTSTTPIIAIVDPFREAPIISGDGLKKNMQGSTEQAIFKDISRGDLLTCQLPDNDIDNYVHSMNNNLMFSDFNFKSFILTGFNLDANVTMNEPLRTNIRLDNHLQIVGDYHINNSTTQTKTIECYIGVVANGYYEIYKNSKIPLAFTNKGTTVFITPLRAVGDSLPIPPLMFRVKTSYAYPFEFIKFTI